MNDHYINVFIEAARSASIVPFTSEPTFYAMKAFGGYDMPQACLLATLGALAGQGFNWWIGTQIAAIPLKSKAKSTARFERCKAFFNDMGIYLLLGCWVPFGNLLVVAAGLFGLPLKKVLPMVALAEAAHYFYYLH